ncbi:hypothetical protein [Streptomyces sp. SLBN-118]|uniref:hypothetical protein n=1 Tax=Streptomyces sp. SLBN-118 TaxID=2768454 RepID=UPI00114DCF70|nr:hypothetical protein [Streptomyces sp. SLBN-118]
MTVRACPRIVYDLTVDDLHTFFVRTSGQRRDDVMVHNCLNLTLHEGDRGAHTIRDHVTIRPQDAVQKRSTTWRRTPSTRERPVSGRTSQRPRPPWTRASQSGTPATGPSWKRG